MYGIVTQPAVNHVVREGDIVAKRQARGIGVRVKRVQLDCFLQRALYVDNRRQRLPGGRDRAVHLAVGNPCDAVDKLTLGGVAPCEDTPIVSEDAVHAGAAGNPVVAPAANDVVVTAITEQAVVPGHPMNAVVAILAVDLVIVGDIIHGRRVEIRPSRCVVKLVHSAGDDAACAFACVYVMGKAQQPARDHAVRADAALGAVHPDQPNDVAVIAKDHVGIAPMSFSCRVQSCPAAIATKEIVCTVGAHRCLREAEELRGTADDVILSQSAEHYIRAATGLDVVVAVGLWIASNRWREDQHPHRRCAVRGRDLKATAGCAERPGLPEDRQDIGRARRQGVDPRDQYRAIALDRVVAKLAENLVVVRATGDVVAAEVIAVRVLDRGAMSQISDAPKGPPRGGRAIGVGIAAIDTRNQRRATRPVEVASCIDPRPFQRLESWRQRPPVKGKCHIVAKHQIVVGTTVKHVGIRAPDQDVIPGAAEGNIRAAFRDRECAEQRRP